MGRTSYKEFAQRWIKNLVDSMDAHLDEDTRRRLMKSCGRACARGGPARAAEGCQGKLDEWLATLAKWHGGQDHVWRDGNVQSDRAFQPDARRPHVHRSQKQLHTI